MGTVYLADTRLEDLVVSSSGSDQLAGLEATVRALEKWRQESRIDTPPRTVS
jgi:hypothetical protein